MLTVHYRRLIGENLRRVMMEIKPAKEYTNEKQVCFLYVKDIDKGIL